MSYEAVTTEQIYIERGHLPPPFVLLPFLLTRQRSRVGRGGARKPNYTHIRRHARTHMRTERDRRTEKFSAKVEVNVHS